MEPEKKAPEPKKLVMKSSTNRPVPPKTGLGASQSVAQQPPAGPSSHTLHTKGSVASLRAAAAASTSTVAASSSSVKLVGAVAESSKQGVNAIYTKSQVVAASANSSSYTHKQPSHTLQSQMAARIQAQMVKEREMQEKGKGVPQEDEILDEDIDLPDIASE